MCKFIIEQYVIINGIMGYIDYIGDEVIILVNNDKIMCINIQDIDNVIILENDHLNNYTIICKDFLYNYSVFK